VGLSEADADALDELVVSYSQAQIGKSPIAYSRLSAGMRLDDNNDGPEDFSLQDASRISQSASQNSRFQEDDDVPQSQNEDDAPESERAAPPKYSAADIAQQLKAAAEELLRKC
jgi:hypothetical protein